ncbi:MAG: hypothetical protein J7507_11975 [Pseudoxanthomonas sp.]|nr:hypothetical protein [Pseudoxanthomonas sp.]
MRWMALPAMAIALGGCSQVELYQFESAAKDAVKQSLVDPDSAQFRDLRIMRRSEHERILCGELNARNRMGGYTGFTPFYIVGNSTHELTFDLPHSMPQTTEPAAEFEAFMASYRQNCSAKA